MDAFTAHHLRFVGEVQTPILLNEHKGSAIRGALFHALKGSARSHGSGYQGFCCNKEAPDCFVCPLHAACPVSFLVATLDDQGTRGREVPRPYTIEPPLDPHTRYQPGETLEFGLTMFARAMNLFPYVILAVQQGMARGGLGRNVAENGWRRGTFTLREVWTENPLTGEQQPVLQPGSELVKVPEVPITHQQVVRAANEMANQNSPLTMRLQFLTPTRLVDGGRLVRRPDFRILMQRLLERLSALAREFCDTPLALDFGGLIHQAETVQLVADDTRWVELESYSTRLGRATPLGGFIGQATFAGDLAPFLPWLLWGQFTHVGKDAVKGNGWYQVTWVERET